jgi:hypothetical protein
MAEFVKGMFVKQGKYGTKVSFKAAEFIEELNSKKNKDGFVNIEIKTSKSGDKLYAQFDTWEPTAKGTTTTQPKQYASKPKGNVYKEDDGLPF